MSLVPWVNTCSTCGGYDYSRSNPCTCRDEPLEELLDKADQKRQGQLDDMEPS